MSNATTLLAQSVAAAASSAIQWQGSKITLPSIPDRMSIDKAVKELLDVKKDLSSVTEVSRSFKGYFPIDAAYAFQSVLREFCGWATGVPIKGFFSDSPPLILSVPTTEGSSVEIIWGRMTIPSVTGHFEIGVGLDTVAPYLTITATVAKEFEGFARKLFNATAESLKNTSIYRHQSLSLDLSWMDAARSGKFRYSPIDHAPSFRPRSTHTKDDLILDSHIRDAIDISLFYPVEYASRFRLNKIPLKRGVLLEGVYGCGKTMTATVLSSLCQQHNFTFFYLRNVKDLAATLVYAKTYGPSVIFAEDLDAVIGTDDRTDKVNELLNTLDGIDFKDKNTEVIVVLSTNHLERINPAMLRPGRLDAVITLSPPTQLSTIEVLLRRAAGGSLPHDEDISSACDILTGQIPAVIVEAVNRARSAAVARSSSPIVSINGDDLVMAANSMVTQVKACNRRPSSTSRLDEAAASLTSAFTSALTSSLSS